MWAWVDVKVQLGLWAVDKSEIDHWFQIVTYFKCIQVLENCSAFGVCIYVTHVLPVLFYPQKKPLLILNKLYINY